MTKTALKKIPVLRFPEFEGEWEEKRLGEVFTFLPTNSFSRALLNNQEGVVKNIHYGDIHTRFRSSFDVLKEEVPFVNQEVDLTKIPKENYCKVGDLIVADASEDYKDVGKAIEIVNLCDQKVISGLHTLMLRDEKNKTAIGFKGYLMQSHPVRLQIMKMATGISVLGISKGNLSKVKLPFPSLPEQQKIASFLSAVDTRIQQLTRKKALLEQYKKGVMQQIFPAEGERIPRVRFPEFEGAGDWEERKIEQITNSIKSGQSKNQSEGNYDVFGSTGIIGKTNYPTHKGEYIIVARVGANAGQINVAKGEFGVTDNTLVVELRNFVNLKFLKDCLTKVNLNRLIFGSGQPLVTGGVLKKIKIYLPSLPEQQKIASFLSALDVKIDQVGQQLVRMQTFKKGLLQQMFM